MQNSEAIAELCSCQKKGPKIYGNLSESKKFWPGKRLCSIVNNVWSRRFPTPWLAENRMSSRHALLKNANSKEGALFMQTSWVLLSKKIMYRRQMAYWHPPVNVLLSPYDPVPKTALQITNIQIIVEANLHANRIAVLEVCARERILFQLAKLSRWGAFLFANDS